MRFVEWQLEAVSKMMAPPCRRSWPGARPSVTATTNAVLELAGHLTAERIEKATPGIDGLLADLGAPRGALSYSPFSGRELEEVFLDLMAYP